MKRQRRLLCAVLIATAPLAASALEVATEQAHPDIDDTDRPDLLDLNDAEISDTAKHIQNELQQARQHQHDNYNSNNKNSLNSSTDNQELQVEKDEGTRSSGGDPKTSKGPVVRPHKVESIKESDDIDMSGTNYVPSMFVAYTEVKENMPDDAHHEAENEQTNVNGAKDTAGGSKRLWGHPDHHPSHVPSDIADDHVSDSVGDKTLTGNPLGDQHDNLHYKSDNESPNVVDDKRTTKKSTSHPHPFVKNKHHDATSVTHSPPEGFVINARVYLDRHDRKAHFDFDDGSLIFPYWDCGTTGSATNALPIKHAVFKHAFVALPKTSAVNDANKVTTDDGGSIDTHQHDQIKNAQLLVALSPLVLELNSGEKHSFDTGSVILLEDTMLPGHQIKPATPTHTEVQALFLTLPSPYYKSGKHNLSLQSYLQQSTASPCDNTNPNKSDAHNTTTSDSQSAAQQDYKKHEISMPVKISQAHTVKGIVDNGRTLRLILWSAIGLSMSTLLADFLGKVAPLWLAVGVGGISLVGTGTYGVVKLFEYIFTVYVVHRERRKIEAPSVSQKSKRHNDDVDGVSNDHFMPTQNNEQPDDETEIKVSDVGSIDSLGGNNIPESTLDQAESIVDETIEAEDEADLATTS